MRWSQLYVPTLREDPADADAPSHRLLVRAGYARQLMAGHYSLLPLAVRVRAKVMAIVREEMDRIGAQEWLLPTMHPAEIWQRSGRWEVMGDELFRLRDRRGADLALGMTHEEIFTTVAAELASYRQLPQIWYQFQTKFRDEPRPKSGLLRVREFTMKDSYSFDLDEAGLDRSFELHREAYGRIFRRLGLAVMPVEASSGTMGGNASVEFMSPTEAGEDLVVHCTACGYAANVEKATSRPSAVEDGAGLAAPEPFDTPEARTIEELTVRHGVPAEQQIKTLVYVVDDRLTLVLMRGDHSLVEQKLIDATGAVAVRPAQPEEIRAALGASPGSLGAVGVGVGGGGAAVGVGGGVGGLPVLADEVLRGRRAMTTGANRDGVHLRGVDVERDIAVTGWADFREACAGEPCVRCGQPLAVVRTVEVGHIFKLGRRYTEVLDVTVLGPDGERIHPVMGSYGIGVERALAAVVEAHHDERGIVWPVAVAPFEVAIVPVGKADEESARVVAELYEGLRAARVDVVLDDRDERPGVKFADIELTGIPYRLTVGPRGLKDGVVELLDRASGETALLAVGEAVKTVLGLVTEARTA